MRSNDVSGIWIKILSAIILIAMSVNLYMIFLFAPEERSMGHVQRIFYFHVPIDWTMFLAFFLVFIGSIMFLWKRNHKYDVLAHSSAEIGVVFATLAIISGSLWARPAWNVWWVWSPRLTTFLIMWFTYIAYLMLHGFVDNEEQRARFSSVFGICAFVNIPVVYFSTRLWNDIHPGQVIGGGENSGLDPEMRITFFVSLFTFTLFFIFLLILRIRLQNIIESLDNMKRNMSLDEFENAEISERQRDL